MKEINYIKSNVFVWNIKQNFQVYFILIKQVLNDKEKENKILNGKMDPQKKSFNPIFDIYSNFMPENTNFKLQTDLGLKLKNIEKQKNKININKEKRIKKFSFTFKNKEDKLNVNENIKFKLFKYFFGGNN